MSKKIIAAIGTIALGVIISTISDLVKSIPLWTSLKDVLYWIWTTIFCAEFAVWQIVLGLLVLFIVLFIINKFKSDNQSEPEFKKYLTDDFDGYIWTWRWGWNNSTGFWNVRKIQPECPNCQTNMHYELNYGNDFYKANCPRCNYYAIRIKSYKDVEAIILDNIRRKRDENENKKST